MSLNLNPTCLKFDEVESQNESVNPNDKPINSSSVSRTATIQEEVMKKIVALNGDNVGLYR
jgi:hypothetical protein